MAPLPQQAVQLQDLVARFSPEEQTLFFQCVIDSVTNRVADTLSREELKVLDALCERVGHDDPEVVEFLITHVPGYQDIVNEECGRLAFAFTHSDTP